MYVTKEVCTKRSQQIFYISVQNCNYFLVSNKQKQLLWIKKILNNFICFHGKINNKSNQIFRNFLCQPLQISTVILRSYPGPMPYRQPQPTLLAR